MPFADLSQRVCVGCITTTAEDAIWTGAEILACCRLAAMLDLPLREAAQHVVPIAVTAGESVDRLRRGRRSLLIGGCRRHLPQCEIE